MSATLRAAFRGFVDLVYPPTCMACGAEVDRAGALCPGCWAGARFIDGAVCDGCGRPLGILLEPGPAVRCSDCEEGRHLWRRGRAAVLYEGAGRALVLSLKHADRPDLAPPLARWMARAGRDLFAEVDLVVPIPLYWRRCLSRRYNQSAELSRALARTAGLRHAPGVLVRTSPTESQRGKTLAQRRDNLAGAFAVPARTSIAGQRILLVDDVLTTGATLDSASAVLRAAGAASVDILVFARVARDAEFDGMT